MMEFVMNWRRGSSAGGMSKMGSGDFGEAAGKGVEAAVGRADKGIL
jgi:hypothetical protein